MKTRLGFILIMLISCTINIFLPNTALTAVILSLCLTTIVALIFLLILAKRATVEITMKNLVTVLGGSGSKICIEVNNKLFVGSPSVHLLVTVTSRLHKVKTKECFTFPVAPRDNTRLTIAIHSIHCDKTIVLIEKIVFTDFLGIFSVKRKINQGSTILTMPQPSKLTAPIEIKAGDDSSGNEYSDYLSGDDRSMVFDYHEYRSGDNIKDINWKLSARLESLVVKEFSLPITSSVSVIAEISSEEDIALLDYNITVLYALSEWLHDKGQTHNIQWFCSDRGLLSSKIDHTLTFEEEFFSALDMLYETSLCDVSSLDVYIANVIERDINTIYLTNKLDDHIVDQLISFAQNTKLTLLYTNKSIEIPPAFISKLQDNDITII